MASSPARHPQAVADARQTFSLSVASTPDDDLHQRDLAAVLRDHDAGYVADYAAELFVDHVRASDLELRHAGSAVDKIELLWTVLRPHAH